MRTIVLLGSMTLLAAGCGKPEIKTDDEPVGIVHQALTLQLEAENGTNNGGQLEGGGDSGSKVILNSSGDSVCWSNTNMAGINKVTIHQSNGEPAGDTLIAKYNGSSLGTVSVASTSGWSSPLFTNRVIDFASQSGTGTFCVEGSGSGWIAGVDYVVLEGSSTCTSDCTGKACGDDGCGNSCGSCQTGEACTAQNTCEPICTPNCTGKVCGDDGCGNSCGNCSSGQTCTSAGQCTSSCTPNCSGKTCGSDGCGGSCGTCSAGNTCSAGGQCVPSGGTRTIRLEAEAATLSGCTIEGGGDSGSKVVNFSAGDTICWPNTDMQNMTGIKIHYGNAEPPGDTLNLSYAGTSIATFSVGSTGGWSSPQLSDLTKSLSGATAGSGTVCLDGSGSNWLASVDYVEISGPCARRTAAAGSAAATAAAACAAAATASTTRAPAPASARRVSRAARARPAAPTAAAAAAAPAPVRTRATRAGSAWPASRSARARPAAATAVVAAAAPAPAA